MKKIEKLEIIKAELYRNVFVSCIEKVDKPDELTTVWAGNRAKEAVKSFEKVFGEDLK